MFRRNVQILSKRRATASPCQRHALATKRHPLYWTLDSGNEDNVSLTDTTEPNLKPSLMTILPNIMAEIDNSRNYENSLPALKLKGARDPSRHMALLENSSNKAEGWTKSESSHLGSQHCYDRLEQILKNTNSCSLNSSSFPITKDVVILLCPGCFVPQEMLFDRTYRSHDLMKYTNKSITPSKLAQ